MKLIQGLNDQPKQQTTLTLENGTQVSLFFEYRPQQYGWFYNIEAGDFVLQGQRLVSSPNILSQFVTKLPFGISVLTMADMEPTKQDAFIDGSTVLLLVESFDLAAITLASHKQMSASTDFVTWADLRDYIARLPGGNSSSTGAAGGDLSGAYPNPKVSKLTETSGPTALTIVDIADGQFLKRVGDTVVGVAVVPGAGDVVGPAGTTDNHVAVFDGATGKLLKSGGAAVGSAAFSPASDFATPASVTTAQTAAEAAASAAAAAASTATSAASTAASAVSTANTASAAAASAVSTANTASAAAASAVSTANTAQTAATNAGTAAAAALTAANLRVQRSHLPLNVKFYGAIGDGVANDRAAIATAIAAMTPYSALYFPPGKYRIASVIGDISGMNNCAFIGDQAEIYNDTGASGGNTLVFSHTCSKIQVHGIKFTGSSSVRGNGIHIRMGCSNSTIRGCHFEGCSDFGVLVSHGSGAGWISNINVLDCSFNSTLGDGVHVGAATDVLIANCHFVNTGDDAIGIIADTESLQPNRVSVIGCTIYLAGAGGSGCGIRINEGTDIVLCGNAIYDTQEAGIFVGRYLSTSAYNARIFIVDNKIVYSNDNAGHGGGITVQYANQCTIQANKVEAPDNGGGIAFADCNNLVVQSNLIKTCPGRGIALNDGVTAVNNCTNVVINGNTIDNCGTSGSGTEAIYVCAPATKTVSDVLITGNVVIASPAGNYIFTNRLGGIAKIYNNTVLEAGRTIGSGGVGVSALAGNNN